MIHPHIIHRTGDILTLSSNQVDTLREDPRPILWVNAGLYALIPIEVIKNELEFITNHDKLCEMVELPTVGPGEWSIQLHWEQAVEVPVSTGIAMEQYNGSKLERGLP